MNPYDLFSVSYLKDKLLKDDIPNLEANRVIISRACKTITRAIFGVFFQKNFLTPSLYSNQKRRPFFVISELGLSLAIDRFRLSFQIKKLFKFEVRECFLAHPVLLVWKH